MEWNIVATSISLAASLAALWTAWLMKESLKKQVLTSDNSTLQFILHEYSESEFLETVDSKEIKYIRDARVSALSQWNNSHEDWYKRSAFSAKGNWENRYAYKASLILEHLGAATFTGQTPIKLLLGVFAVTIIDDWILCHQWVNEYREDIKTKRGGDFFNRNVYYHRRHAEWLGILAALWMKKYWPNYKRADELLQSFNKEPRRMPAHIIYTSIMEADANLMPKHIRKELDTLVGAF